MGVRKVCTEGYVVENCRCPNSHYIAVITCDPERAPHVHNLRARDEDLRSCGLGHLVSGELQLVHEREPGKLATLCGAEVRSPGDLVEHGPRVTCPECLRICRERLGQLTKTLVTAADYRELVNQKLDELRDAIRAHKLADVAVTLDVEVSLTFNGRDATRVSAGIIIQ